MENKAVTVGALSVVIIVLIILSRRQKVAEAEKKRRELLKSDYPEIISRLLLYLKAGLVCRSAFFRIAADYKKELVNRNIRILSGPSQNPQTINILTSPAPIPPAA